jgi:hypothetical protein
MPFPIIQVFILLLIIHFCDEQAADSKGQKIHTNICLTFAIIIYFNFLPSHHSCFKHCLLHDLYSQSFLQISCICQSLTES